MTSLKRMGYSDFDRNYSILNRKEGSLDQAIEAVVEEYAQLDQKNDKI